MFYKLFKTTSMEHYKNNIQQEGFVIIPSFFTENDMDYIIEQLDKMNVLKYDKPISSDFNLIQSMPFVYNLANSNELISLVKEVLGTNAFPINAFVLDKTKDYNWGLDWHQDLKIAVKHKIETVGYSNWTVESGITHTVPPIDILEKRLALRIHLDNCFLDNGAILVVPKSHVKGIIKDIDEITKTDSKNIVCCEVKKGGIMLFKPMLLHKSPYSVSDKNRRILQIDYVGTALNNGLEWNN